VTGVTVVTGVTGATCVTGLTGVTSVSQSICIDIVFKRIELNLNKAGDLLFLFLVGHSQY
jgi:hypothetical protein